MTEPKIYNPPQRRTISKKKNLSIPSLLYFLCLKIGEATHLNNYPSFFKQIFFRRLVSDGLVSGRLLDAVDPDVGVDLNLLIWCHENTQAFFWIISF